MKKITLITSLFCSFVAFSQALDTEKAFADETNKLNDISRLLQMAEENLNKSLYTRHETVMKRLIKLRPFNPDFRLELAKSYALQNDKSAAYNELIELQKAGLSYVIGDRKGFDNIKGTKVFDYIEDEMIKNGQAFGEGEKAFTISHHYSGMLFENMAYDSKQKRFLLGSVRAGSIYQYTEKDGFEEFIKPSNPATGPWGTIDLVADNKADVLWVSSATLPHYTGTTQTNFGRAMISKFKLSTGELIKNYVTANSNKPMLFSAMHLTSGQNLYFVDAFGSDFYRIKKDSETVEPLISLPGLASVKAITSNETESILYVSDYEQGLFVINLKELKVKPLIQTGKGFIAGISDVFYDQGDLVAIQSGVSPVRLMRYVLEKDLFLRNMFPIEASHPTFKSLGNGLLVGDYIYYAANSQWEKLDPMGRLLPEQTWEPLEIIKSPTKYMMEEHEQQQQRMEEIKRKRGIK